MAEFERREAEKRDAERSKNDLEAYIISTGGILEDGAYNEVRLATPFSHSCHSIEHSPISSSQDHMSTPEQVLLLSMAP